MSASANQRQPEPEVDQYGPEVVSWPPPPSSSSSALALAVCYEPHHAAATHHRADSVHDAAVINPTAAGTSTSFVFTRQAAFDYDSAAAHAAAHAHAPAPFRASNADFADRCYCELQRPAHLLQAPPPAYPGDFTHPAAYGWFPADHCDHPVALQHGPGCPWLSPAASTTGRFQSVDQ